ncbi:aquaporin Z [Gordonia sp. KTR9]|uniref:aquaporin Z n=1 Tax=Gordonia sp. KTR9 TaxID=337191 RepID=UPI00027DDFF4|nr:aquaporin Z [Gordonia sp. KTR9]AFR49531.1 Glycerol uptake facilitator and related permeases (Major Intrinsic Protein Family) [Gordonia sp. KTR9]
MPSPSPAARLAAEFFGTFWLVFGGCGSAIYAAKQIAQSEDGQDTFQVGIGFLGVALAFGLTVVTMAYAVGHVSGAHFNPAITLGAAVSGRLSWKDLPTYWIAQVVGGLLAGLMLFLIAKGQPGFEAEGNMAANGFGEHSPGNYSLAAVLIAEILLTAFFLIVILGATDGRAPAGFGPLAIGLCLTLIHLISIPISNTSVNPARSTAVAFFNGNGAPGQLWAFWLAPLIGGLIGGLLYPLLFQNGKRSAAEPDRVETADA